MVNIELLNKYVTDKGLTWKEVAAEIGGLPLELEEFAENFENNAGADQIAAIAEFCAIPSSQIGMVFFAPAWYDEHEIPHLADLADYSDILVDTVRSLSDRDVHKIIGLAFYLQDEAHR